MQLVIIKPFSPPAKLAALQLLDDDVKALDLGLCLAEVGALDCERAHQLLQYSYIVRQRGEIDIHDEQKSS